MGRLLYLMWDIVRLRRGPQDLPYSPRLLAGVCALGLLLQWAIAHVAGGEHDVMALALVSLAFTLGVLFLLLNLRGLRNRFVQAALALVCCALLFMVLDLPVTLLFGTPPLKPEQMTTLQFALAMISLPLVIWKLLVDAHILRHSLDVPFLAGIGIALLWLVAELALVAAVAPPALA